jgi:hypothetical protein
MARSRRPRGQYGETKTTAMRMPVALYDRLEVAAQAANRSLAEEIRLRLEGSFRLDGSTRTRELLEQVARVAGVLDEAYGHDSEFAGAVLADQVKAQVAPYEKDVAWQEPKPGSRLHRFMDPSGLALGRQTQSTVDLLFLMSMAIMGVENR